MIGSFTDARRCWASSIRARAAKLAHLGTSCPDHFIRTKIRPMFVHWDPLTEDQQAKAQATRTALEKYRNEYADYYQKHALTDSPAHA